MLFGKSGTSVCVCVTVVGSDWTLRYLRTDSLYNRDLCPVNWPLIEPELKTTIDNTSCLFFKPAYKTEYIIDKICYQNDISEVFFTEI